MHKPKPTLLMAVVACAGMIVLILDFKTALAGATEGIELCLRSVIPSLFPFICLSSLITSQISGKRFPLLRPLGKLLKIPEGFEYLLVLGLLGGYPIGAQNIAYVYQTGALQRNTAERLLAFCNNAGPAYILGFLSLQFSSKITVWTIWSVQILSALLTGYLYPGKCVFDATVIQSGRSANHLKRSLKITAEICGWIILFRVLLNMCSHWFLWILPENAQIIFMGLSELTNGCIALSKIASEAHRFVICSTMLSFGGLCVFMQVAGVTEGLSLKTYFAGKLFQTCVSFTLSSILQIFIFNITAREALSTIIGGILMCIIVIHIIRRKNSSIMVKSIV